MSEALHSSLSTSKIREYLNQSPTFHQAISRSSNYSSSPSPSQRSSSRLRATPSPSQPKRVYLQLKAQTPNFKSSRSSSKPPTSPIPKTVHKTPPASPVPKFVHQTPRKIDFKLSNDLIEPADQNAHNTSFMRPCYKEPKDSLSRSFELDIIQPVQNKQCLTPDKSSSSGSLDSSDITKISRQMSLLYNTKVELTPSHPPESLPRSLVVYHNGKLYSFLINSNN